MDWLRFTSELPQSSGQVVLDCSYSATLVLLAYLVACAASFATLDMAERVSHAEHPASRRHWRWAGAGCLAGGIWAMHFIGMLAFLAPVNLHYDLPITLLSLLIALIAGVLAMNTLSAARLTVWRHGLASIGVGLGIAAMHYVGMAAMHSDASQYFEPWLLALSIVIAIVASGIALLLWHLMRDGSGVVHQALKYLTSLVLGAAIVSMHFTGMWAMTLVMPESTLFQTASDENQLQLGMTIAVIALLVIGSTISAALADKKLQHKEHDLQRVQALLGQLDQARMSLQQAAHYDSLTNLLNRRGFNQLFAEKIVEKCAQGGRLAIMFLDIDHFKRINDSLGHDAGDDLLKILAGHLKSSIRSHADLVARFGGDEFCVLLNLQEQDEARHVALRILAKMKEPVALAGRSMVMTTSIGISLFPEDDLTCDELLKSADLALYQAKANGRNGFCFFNQALKTKATIALQLEEELRNALRQDQGLLLYYQPIYDLATGQVTKLEALVRWQHPTHGLLTPERFLTIAEANGLIAELDHWVLRKACEDLGQLSGPGCDSLKIAVNCSPLNLSRPELAGQIKAALQSASVAAQRLELEVTENALMGNIAETLELLHKIRELGVSLSIDDFGTGYSSLAYLKRLPLNTLKIDRSFIQDIPNSAQDMEIVQAIIVMAHTLHLQVVTEGVETLEQYHFLERLGCDYIQGYLLSCPMPLAELRPILDQVNQRISPLRLVRGTAESM